MDGHVLLKISLKDHVDTTHMEAENHVTTSKDQHASASLQVMRNRQKGCLASNAFSEEEEDEEQDCLSLNSEKTSPTSWIWVAVRYPACFRKRRTHPHQRAPIRTHQKYPDSENNNHPNRVCSPHFPIGLELPKYSPLKDAWLRKATKKNPR